MQKKHRTKYRQASLIHLFGSSPSSQDFDSQEDTVPGLPMSNTRVGAMAGTGLCSQRCWSEVDQVALSFLREEEEVALQDPYGLEDTQVVGDSQLHAVPDKEDTDMDDCVLAACLTEYVQRAAVATVSPPQSPFGIGNQVSRARARVP